MRSCIIRSVIYFIILFKTGSLFSQLDPTAVKKSKKYIIGNFFQDSVYKEWKNNKTYDYHLVQIYFGGGNSMLLRGNTAEAFKNSGIPPNEILKDAPYDMGGTIGFDVSVSSRLKFGLAMLPTSSRRFESKYTQWDFIWILPIQYELRHVKETISCVSFALSSTYVLVADKKFRKMGFELSFGFNIIKNKFKNITNISLCDTIRTYNVANGGYSIQQINANEDYLEEKNVIGGSAFIRLNVRLLKRFFLFSSITLSQSGRFHVKEKELILRDQSVHIPKHYERVSGLGGTFGLGFYFAKKGHADSNF